MIDNSLMAVHFLGHQYTQRRDQTVDRLLTRWLKWSDRMKLNNCTICRY